MRRIIEELLLVKGKPNNIIVAFVGKRRQGKTTGLAFLGYLAHQLGINVAANFWVNYPHFRITKPQDFKKCSNCLALLDDFNRWATSKITKHKKTEIFGDIIDNSGKRSVSIAYSTKYLMQILKPVRHETDFVIYPDPLRKANQIIQIQYSVHDFAMDTVIPKPIEVSTYPTAELFNLFDTRQEIKMI